MSSWDSVTHFTCILSLIALGILASSTEACARSTDQIALEQLNSDSIDDIRIRRITKLAALVPGSGQFMNHKAWKAPIVWGGMAWCASAIRFNNQSLQEARETLIFLELADPSQVNNYSQVLSLARQEESFYRRNRDLSWFALLGVHLLGILDAHVDANLSSFDVSEDLSFQLTPLAFPPLASTPSPPTNSAAWGLIIHWEFPHREFPKFAR